MANLQAYKDIADNNAAIAYNYDAATSTPIMQQTIIVDRFLINVEFNEDMYEASWQDDTGDVHAYENLADAIEAAQKAANMSEEPLDTAERLAAIAAQRDEARARAIAARNYAIYVAAENGATHKELVDASGLSIGAIKKILGQERAAEENQNEE